MHINTVFLDQSQESVLFERNFIISIGFICYLYFHCFLWRPHSFWVASSHHHLPSLSCWFGRVARVHGWHPILINPFSCSLLYGTPKVFISHHTSPDFMSLKGLYFTRTFLSLPSKALSTITYGTSVLVTLWSFLTPVIQARSCDSYFLRGPTFLTVQHSVCPSL